MSCNSPIYALDLGVKENGKRNIKLLPKRVDLSSLDQLERRYGRGNILPLPCGKCLACKLAKAREWAVRCVLEASLYDDNSFLTLTYDDAHLPVDMKVNKIHLQNFIREVRRDHFIRYLACGEYGGSGQTAVNGCLVKRGRPHYHLILFGWCPTEKELKKYWKFGFASVGDCSFRSCDYVARYTTKKIYDDKDDSFILMSTRPGIGYAWLEKHFDIFKYDKICGPFGSGNISNIPRYFEKVFETIDPNSLKELKSKRIDKGLDMTLYEMYVHGLDKVEKLYEYRNEIQVHEFEQKGKRRDL